MKLSKVLKQADRLRCSNVCILIAAVIVEKPRKRKWQYLAAKFMEPNAEITQPMWWVLNRYVGPQGEASWQKLRRTVAKRRGWDITPNGL